MQIFSRYRENTNKVHFEFTDFNSATRVTVYAECNYVFLNQNLVLIAVYHVDC